MWPMSKLDQLTKTVMELKEAAEMIKEQPSPTSSISVPSAQEFGTHKPQTLSDLTLDLLLESKSILQYQGGAVSPLLMKVLADSDIDILDSQKVKQYILSKTTEDYFFRLYPIECYPHPIPSHVLSTALTIKRKMDVSLVVYQYEHEEHEENPLADPFLWVSSHTPLGPHILKCPSIRNRRSFYEVSCDWGVFVEVWDEPEFEERRVK